MDIEKLIETTKKLFADDKGLLAMDESTQSCHKRFAKLGIPETEESRRAWRELIITTPNLSDAISGVILYDETIRQKKLDGTSFVDVIKNAGIIAGIKVDGGLKDFGPAVAQGSGPLRQSFSAASVAKEKVTEGLDGLPERLKEYFDMGARFAKWRAAFTISDTTPSQECIEENAKRLAEYAFLCQEAGIVPIVEPEVIMDGDHSLHQCQQVTEKVLESVFKHLVARGVFLEGMILKPNMIVPGLGCQTQETVEEVAEATVRSLTKMVPAHIAGVAFLSGGQSNELASARLSVMNASFKSQLPWPLTFSYSRAIQYPALEIWQGKEENVQAAQKALYHRAKLNQLARRGEYNTEMEKE